MATKRGTTVVLCNVVEPASNKCYILTYAQKHHEVGNLDVSL